MHAFNVLEKLGKGSFGTVYLCERKHNKLKVVVKEVNVDLNSEQLDSAKNEVAILKALKHPNIIQYKDSFISSGIFYIVMEYATQGSLFEYIKRQRPNFIIQETVLNLFAQILQGVNYIHTNNIIHRDLKSENIFLTGLSADVIKIGDFGISKMLLDWKSQYADYQYAFAHIGNESAVLVPLTPEICHGQPYDTKSDVWSLGCLLYELCALERMFEGPVASVVLSISTGRKKTINLTYDQSIQNMIDTMLKLEPEIRPSTNDVMKYPILHSTINLLGANLGCISWK